MKKIYALIVLAFIAVTSFSQEWISKLPKDKLDEGTLTFYEIRDAFNDYCEEAGVDRKGYYLNAGGEKVRMPYWKLFRRWEWYWEPRVDPVTGEFPKTTASDEYAKYLKTSGAKSLSGNWTSMGPTSSPGGYAGLGRLNCVAFRPTDNNTIYAGAASGGIWKSTDGGSTWTSLGDSNPVLGVSDIIVIKPTSGADIVYIATGDRDGGCVWSLGGGQGNDNNSVGVLKSIDGGATWSATGLTFSANQKHRVNRLLLDPGNTNIIYAATTAGLYKTTDAGNNWTQLTATAFIDMEFHPTTPATMYASTSGSAAIYRSVNSGQNWNQIATYSGNRAELAVSPNAPNTVYAIVSDNSSALLGVYKSTDSGASFPQVYNGSTKNLLGWNCDGLDFGGGQGWYDLAIAADPNNGNTIYIGGVNIWKSTNGGSGFSIISHWAGGCGSTVHADQHFFAFQNGTSTMFVCNDGGLYKTSNGGSSFTHLTNGMAVSQMYRLGVAQTTPNDVITGLQDNGTKALLSGSWVDVLGGDGMECAIKPTDHNTQYGSIYYGNFYRTTDHWGWNVTDISTSLGGSGWWVTPFAIDPSTPSTIYAGYQDVVKSTNQGGNWTKISNWSGYELRHLAIAPSNSNYIYAATTNTLYRTTNGGTSWSNITGTLPVGSCAITYISVKSDDPNTAWVSMGEYNAHGVYETTNGGSTWNNISAGLPQVPVMCVVQNKQNTNAVELYAGTDVGVFVKPGSSNWVYFSNGLPNVVVTELDIYYDNTTPPNSRIRAATYGRGLWESDLYTSGVAPAADFMANLLTPEAEDPVQFTDISGNAPTSWQWSFDPPSVTYLGGTSSSSQHPLVQFADTGFYDVTLIATNTFGADTIEKTDYVQVLYCTYALLPFTEDYPTGTVPICWRNIDHAGYGQVWRFDNPGGRTVNTSSAGNGFAILDSDYFGPGGSQDADLTTPVLDLTDYIGVRLEFEHYFLSYPGSVAILAFSLDSGTTWTPVQTWVTTTANAELFSQDVSALVAGHPYVKFKWNFVGSDANYWAVDDINIFGTDVLPAADFSASETIILAGGSVTYTDASTGNPDNWVWTFEGGDPSSYVGQSPPPVVYNSSGIFTTTLYVSNIWGNSTLTLADLIQVGLPPEAGFFADDTVVAVGGVVNFTDLSGNEPDEWIWTFEGGEPASFVGQFPPAVGYLSPGTYNVTLYVSNLWGDNTLLQSDLILVGFPPEAGFAADVTTIFPGEAVVFTDQSLYEPLTWEWTFTGGIPENSILQDPGPVSYPVAGLFDVRLKVTNDFGMDILLKEGYIEVLPVGNTEIPDAGSIKAFPNPNDGSFTVTLSGDAPWQISLINEIGEVILKRSDMTGSIRVDLGATSRGIYLLRAMDDKGRVFSSKIICR